MADAFDIDEIERLAKAATPGPWTIYESRQHSVVGPSTRDCISSPDCIVSPSTHRALFSAHYSDRTLDDDNANMAFIVATQPSVILNLIAAYRTLEERLRKMEEALKPFASYGAYEMELLPEPTGAGLRTFGIKCRAYIEDQPKLADFDRACALLAEEGRADG